MTKTDTQTDTMTLRKNQQIQKIINYKVLHTGQGRLLQSDLLRVSLRLNLDFCEAILCFFSTCYFNLTGIETNVLQKSNIVSKNPTWILAKSLGCHFVAACPQRSWVVVKFTFETFFLHGREYLLSWSNNSCINRVPPAPVAPVKDGALCSTSYLHD